jgi:hypothetical protein
VGFYLAPTSIPAAGLATEAFGVRLALVTGLAESLTVAQFVESTLGNGHDMVSDRRLRCEAGAADRVTSQDGAAHRRRERLTFA